MTIRRQLLLIELLQAIVREWGREHVLESLNGLYAKDSLGYQRTNEENLSHSEKRKTQSRKKLSAVQQVAKTNQPDARRNLLTMIATKYDEKRFLPSVGDVREFLLMRGEKRRLVKDRSEGFRLFLASTREMPLEQLQDLATSSIFSGPSQLAPLSEAIGASGEARRQENITPNESSKRPDHNSSSDFTDDVIDQSHKRTRETREE